MACFVLQTGETVGVETYVQSGISSSHNIRCASGHTVFSQAEEFTVDIWRSFGRCAVLRTVALAPCSVANCSACLDILIDSMHVEINGDISRLQSPRKLPWSSGNSKSPNGNRLAETKPQHVYETSCFNTLHAFTSEGF